MTFDSDFLVIGGGLAGLRFALAAAELGQVTLIAKAGRDDANTYYAQGGIACVWGDDDSLALHVEDTMRAGAGLCHREAVEAIVGDGPAAVRELIELGVRFTRSGDGVHYDLGREGGHCRRRVLHALDLTGNELMRALGEAAGRQGKIERREAHEAIDLLIAPGHDGKPQCWGAYALDRKSGQIHHYRAPLTMLATGGAGMVYRHTSNPRVATGDGIAIALRAGAQVANLEFYQFHPTCLYHPGAKPFLISEALRGEGAILKLPGGERFMPRYHSDAELAPRDVVARAIDAEMKRHGQPAVLLDVSHREAGFVRQRFPNIYAHCLKLGIDITREPMPVVPAAHYMCGGVRTDLWGRTSLDGLLAAGEVAMTGLHGANRLASNSLLEAVVMARRAAMAAPHELARLGGNPPVFPDLSPARPLKETARARIAAQIERLRDLMWARAGIVRDDADLARAQDELCLLAAELERDYQRFGCAPEVLELRNLVAVGEAIVRCAARRTESRGAHYNRDHPLSVESWRHDSQLGPSH
ncbi:MAG TPA: L-aspartate oxidase [Candidatus Binataceae bacterium]|nr:L-aspartate oxidase [Candidatus Binataceae bacterium]